MKIKVMEKVLAANDAWAEENRNFLKSRNIKMLNIIGAPGAGKTTFLEKTIDLLSQTVKIGIIEGDIATSRDAERILQKNIPVYQINTGTACHLDANLVNTALRELCADTELDIIFVENIGNLVCPAEFDIGEHAKIALLSVAEGDDKIEKYPLLFSETQYLIITKTALLDYMNFNVEAAYNDFRKLNPNAKISMVDSLNGEGFDNWIDFLAAREFENSLSA